MREKEFQRKRPTHRRSRQTETHRLFLFEKHTHTYTSTDVSCPPSIIYIFLADVHDWDSYVPPLIRRYKTQRGPILIRTITGEHYWLHDWSFSTTTSGGVQVPAPTLKEQFQQSFQGELFDASLLSSNGGTVNDFADTYEFVLAGDAAANPGASSSAGGDGRALDTRMDSDDMARVLGRFVENGRFRPALARYPGAALTAKMKERLTLMTEGKIWDRRTQIQLLMHSIVNTPNETQPGDKITKTTFNNVLKPNQIEAWVKVACQSLEDDAAKETIDRLEKEHDAYTRQCQTSAQEQPDLEKERYGHLPLLLGKHLHGRVRYQTVHKHPPIEFVLVWKAAPTRAATVVAGGGSAVDTEAMPRPLEITSGSIEFNTRNNPAFEKATAADSFVITSGSFQHPAFDKANQATDAKPSKELTTSI